MFSPRTGYFLALLTAIISGFSIFLNKFAVAETNSFVFTFLKNSIVAVFLLSAILLLKEFPAVKNLAKSQWLQLALLGLVGGSIPFLLFFFALQSTSAVNAGFVQKTMFVFASVFAFVFLKEKISKNFLLAAVLLLLGNFFMFSAFSEFAFADLLVLAAVLFWAVEAVIAKRIMQKIDSKISAFGRMFFGALFMLVFLVFSNQLQFAGNLSVLQLQWILLVSIPLLFYVLTFYSALKTIPVSKATAILMLGQPVTLLLSFAFLNKALSFNQALGIALTLSAILLLFCSSYAVSFLRSRGFLLAGTK